MNEIPDTQLLEWNRRGFIPGPDESEVEYLARVEYCLKLRSQLPDSLKNEAPFTWSPAEQEHILEKTVQNTKKYYDIALDWIPLFFNDYHLPPWHGGCAWIFQEESSQQTGAILQLRRAFASSPTYLKIYHRDEVLTHELCHVGRMKFEEPLFEEFLAYRSSPSTLRRWLGPIVQSQWESLLFVGTLLLILILEFSALLLGQETLYTMALWAKIVLLGILLLGLGRLWRRHRQLNRCFERIKAVVGDGPQANGVIYRLTDNEILAFSQGEPLDIKRFVEVNRSRTLRWHTIAQAYFPDLCL